MKKTLLWGAIASLFFVSCSKNEMVESIESSCDFVAQLADVSRTELDGTAVIWNAEDELTIFTKTMHNRHYKVKTLSEDGRTATFGFVDYTGTSNGTISANYAVYPYDAQATLNDDVISTVIASEQQYNAEKVDLSYALMAAKSESNSFAFVNAGALMRFNISKSELIPDSYTLNSIKLSSAANNIAGDVTIDLSAESRAVVASTGTKQITLTAINQEITTEAKAFYVALPAVSFTDKELTVTFTFADGEKSFALPAFDLLQGSIKTIAYQINDADDFTGTTPDSGEDFEGETPGEEPVPANNEIWYTSTDGNIVEPHDSSVFGANIVSNTYENGKGVITFDGEVTKIGDNAFYECQSLTSITIPDSVTEIETNPFLLCFNLTEFKGKFASKDGKCLIEDQGDGGFVVLRAFAGAGLTEYSIPDGVTALDNCVFKGWGFTSITIPDSVTSMGIEVFYCCNNLRSITIPDSVEGILMNTFWGCSNLRNVTIGNGVTSIGRYAFCRCENLTDISLGSHVETIEQGAFSMCSSLESITIPDSVTEIGSHTFEYCGNLSEFKGKFAADNGRCLIIDGVLNSFAPAGITTYNIPNGVTEIGDYAFEFCSGLTSITIPDSVTEIGDDAFGYCENLASVFCKRITPPAITISINSFVGKIYVPAESVDAYKTADGWKDYADSIEPYDF